MNIYDEVEEALEIVGLQSTGNNNEGKVKDMFEYKLLVKAIKRAKKVEELLTYQNHYIDSIVIELDRITNKAKASQIEIIKKELEEMK